MVTITKEQQRVNIYSNALMILTSIHHLYGSVIYNTPWRAHVLFLSIPVILLTLILTQLIKKNNGPVRKFWFGLYWIIILLASVFMTGMFEGLYNHVLKDVLFFSGVSVAWLRKIFPPGMYEMPNDAFFEITGIVQGIIAVLLIGNFIKLTGVTIENKKQFV